MHNEKYDITTNYRRDKCFIQAYCFIKFDHRKTLLL